MIRPAESLRTVAWSKYISGKIGDGPAMTFGLTSTCVEACADWTGMAKRPSSATSAAIWRRAMVLPPFPRAPRFRCDDIGDGMATGQIASIGRRCDARLGHDHARI